MAAAAAAAGGMPGQGYMGAGMGAQGGMYGGQSGPMGQMPPPPMDYYGGQYGGYGMPGQYGPPGMQGYGGPPPPGSQSMYGHPPPHQYNPYGVPPQGYSGDQAWMGMGQPGMPPVQNQPGVPPQYMQGGYMTTPPSQQQNGQPADMGSGPYQNQAPVSSFDGQPKPPMPDQQQKGHPDQMWNSQNPDQMAPTEGQQPHLDYMSGQHFGGHEKQPLLGPDYKDTQQRNEVEIDSNNKVDTDTSDNQKAGQAQMQQPEQPNMGGAYGMMPGQPNYYNYPGMPVNYGQNGNMMVGQGQDTQTQPQKKRASNLIRLTESQVDELNKIYLNEKLTDNEVLYQI